MRVFVTGLAGFLMSHVADHLLKAGHKVWGVDNLSGGVEENVPDGAINFVGDITHGPVIESLFDHFQPEVCIHGAAMAAENLSNFCRVFTIQNNLVGESIIRNACINHGVKCMISLSSIAVMGHQKPPFFDGTTPLPADPYGITKFAGELDARAAHDFHGLNFCVCRPHNVIGVRQNYSDPHRNVAAIFVRQAIEGRPFTIFGDGSQTRAFSPVSYVAQIIAETVDRPDVWNQAFNVGSDQVMTVKSLAELVAQIAEVPIRNLGYLPARKEASHAHMIHSICQKHFAHVPQQSIEEVIREMVAEARAKGFRPMQKGPEIEVHAGLPESWR